MPFILYGHSMGAVLGLYISKYLQNEHDSPTTLVVSGNPGPDLLIDRRVHTLPTRSFKDELRKMGGISDDFFNDEELFNFFSPIIRADFEIVETGNIHRLSPLVLDIPIKVLMGSEEENVEQISNWSKYSNNDVETIILPGNHFFIRAHSKYLSRTIISCLNCF